MKQKSFLVLILLIASNLVAYLSLLSVFSPDLFFLEITMVLIYIIILIIAFFCFKSYKNSSLLFFALFFAVNLVNILILFVKYDINSPLETSVIYITDIIGLMFSVLSINSIRTIKVTNKGNKGISLFKSLNFKSKKSKKQTIPANKLYKTNKSSKLKKSFSKSSLPTNFFKPNFEENDDEINYHNDYIKKGKIKKEIGVIKNDGDYINIESPELIHSGNNNDFIDISDLKFSNMTDAIQKKLDMITKRTTTSTKPSIPKNKSKEQNNKKKQSEITLKKSTKKKTVKKKKENN